MLGGRRLPLKLQLCGNLRVQVHWGYFLVGRKVLRSDPLCVRWNRLPRIQPLGHFDVGVKAVSWILQNQGSFRVLQWCFTRDDLQLVPVTWADGSPALKENLGWILSLGDFPLTSIKLVVECADMIITSLIFQIYFYLLWLRGYVQPLWVTFTLKEFDTILPRFG